MRSPPVRHIPATFAAGTALNSPRPLPYPEPLDQRPPNGGTLRLSRHDRLQIDLKVSCNVREVLQAAAGFELDLWLLLPGDLGVGPRRAPAETLYQDLRVRSRLRTPLVRLEDLAAPAGRNSPLAALRGLSQNPDLSPAWQRDVRREARLVARVLRSAGRRVLAACHPGSPHLSLLLPILCAALQEVGPRYREVVAALRKHRLSADTLLCLDATDEYLSLQTELLATRAVALVDALAAFGELRGPLVAVARREDALRRDQGWRSRMPDPAHQESEEAFLDQASALKLYVERVLYLRHIPSRVQRVAHNTILGLAAALAMSWAVGLQVFALYSLGLDLSRGAGTSIVVAFSSIAVFGYILKDRIKAWSAEVLARQLPRFLDDRGASLTWGIANTVLGRATERLSYVPANQLDPAVRARHLEALGGRLPLEIHDDVLHYRRRLVLLPRTALEVFPNFAGINESIRINLARWVRTLDDPKRSIVVLDENDRPVTRTLPHRTAMPAVSRLRWHTRDGRMEERWAVHRLLLTQRGVARVETILAGPEDAELDDFED